MTLTERASLDESVEEFSERVRAWAAEHLSRIGAGEDRLVEQMKSMELLGSPKVARGRALLRLLTDAGFGGLVFPREYGGQGLPVSYLRAFHAAVSGYDLSPLGTWVLSLGMNGPALLDYGTEDQKRRFLPRIFRGDDLWIQYLSEPTGGSDLASALTRADRDGDEWVLNGSKIWTTNGDCAEWAMCLARTNWDVPKHRGLSVFLVPTDAPGLSIVALRTTSGQTGFCQEYFEDVRLPADAVLGQVNDGWAVASRLLVHERNVLNGGSEYWIPPAMGAMRPSGGAPRRDDLVDLAAATGQAKDPHVRQLVAEAYANGRVAQQLGPRVTTAMRNGLMAPAASSILKLASSANGIRRSDISMDIAGSDAVVWTGADNATGFGPGAGGRGLGYLSRQAAGLISGTSEIQRNIISERVLDLPREPATDRELPFSEVRHNRMPTARG